MLRIKHLTKQFGDKKAVDDLNLEIPSGVIYGFIGHNGAGKTTTIKSVVGILPIDQGEIYIDGQSVKNDPISCKKLIAYIPDNPDIYPFMKGIDYLNFLADVYQIDGETRTSRIDYYAHLFEIFDNLNTPINEYSHGMKQKLVIIGAFIHEPKLIILDEPFVGLDPKASHTLKQLMRQHCDKGNAIFFSTHVLEVAEKLCDEVAIIKNGKLIKNGPTASIVGDHSLEDVFLELEGDE